jgi:hypothetical protein
MTEHDKNDRRPWRLRRDPGNEWICALTVILKNTHAALPVFYIAQTNNESPVTYDRFHKVPRASSLPSLPLAMGPFDMLINV